MRVEPDTMFTLQRGGGTHELGRDGTRGTRRQCYPDHGSRRIVVICVDDPLRIANNRLDRLDYALWRQSSLPHTQIHAASRRVEADSNLTSRSDLGVDEVLTSLRKNV